MYVKRLLCSSSYASKTKVILLTLILVVLASILYLQLLFLPINVRVIQRERAVQRVLRIPLVISQYGPFKQQEQPLLLRQPVMEHVFNECLSQFTEWRNRRKFSPLKNKIYIRTQRCMVAWSLGTSQPYAF